MKASELVEPITRANAAVHAALVEIEIAKRESERRMRAAKGVRK